MATRLQDIQAALTRTEEVAKLQQTQHQAPQVSQEQIAAQIQQEKQAKRTQAQETRSKDQAKIRDEDMTSRQRRYVSSRRKPVKARKTEETKKQPSVSTTAQTGNRIDLKV